MGFDNGQKIVLFIGRLEPVKGLKYLIEAINILKSKRKKYETFGRWYGSEADNLKRLVKTLELKEDVIFIGKRPNQEIPAYLTASDVFVLPSLSEGFPNVILEAMAAFLPIVTTKIRGLSEIVKDSINGFLVEPKSPMEIADKINLILNNDNLAKKISRTNKDRSNFYDWENITGMLENLYNQ